MAKLAGALHQPKNTLPRIESVYAFVSVDPEDGNEGIIAAPIGGMTMPMIAADVERLAILKPIAAEIAVAFGVTVKLIRLTTREELETFFPRSNAP